MLNTRGTSKIRGKKPAKFDEVQAFFTGENKNPSVVTTLLHFLRRDWGRSKFKEIKFPDGSIALILRDPCKAFEAYGNEALVDFINTINVGGDVGLEKKSKHFLKA